jgi:hypothetical protein
MCVYLTRNKKYFNLKNKTFLNYYFIKILSFAWHSSNSTSSFSFWQIKKKLLSVNSEKNNYLILFKKQINNNCESFSVFRVASRCINTFFLLSRWISSLKFVI